MTTGEGRGPPVRPEDHADGVFGNHRVEESVAGQEIPVEADEKVEVLARKFGVSQQAMMFRLINLGYLRQAG